MHLPLTDSTKGIINKETISKMKKGVKIINCARGGLVVEEDLKVAIDEGHVSGAAFDVFEVEKEGMNSPLFGNLKVVCTPHLGASTHEAQKNVAELIAQQISAYLMEGAVRFSVNMPSVGPEEHMVIEPYMKLCGKISSILGQLSRSNDIVQIDVH